MPDVKPGRRRCIGSVTWDGLNQRFDGADARYGATVCPANELKSDRGLESRQSRALWEWKLQRSDFDVEYFVDRHGPNQANVRLLLLR